MSGSRKRKDVPVMDKDEDRPEPPTQKRRLNLVGIKRKYVPAGTLIASLDTVVTELALPSKNKKFIKYDISEDGEATRIGVVTEQQFVESNSNVDRMDVRASLANDGTIEPSRLSRNTSNVKRSKKERLDEGRPGLEVEPNEPVEESKESKEPEPKEEMEEKKEEEKELTLDVEEAPEPVSTEVSTEQATMEIKEDMNDEVVEDSPGESVVTIEKADDPLSEVGVLTEYATTLREAMRTQTDPKIKKTQLTELLSIIKDIEYIKSQEDMPVMLEKAEVHEAEEIAEEREQIVENTVEQQQAFADAKESPDNKLSAGVVANVVEKEVVSGAHIDVDMRDQVDATEADAADPTKQDAKDRNDVPPIVDVDMQVSDKNQDDATTLGADRHEDVLEQHRSQVTSVSSSANHMESVVSKMEVVTKAELRAEEKEIQKRQKTEAEIEAKRQEIENQMDTSLTETEQQAEMDRRMTAFLNPEPTLEDVAERERQVDLGEAGIDIPGVPGIMKDLKSRGLIEDAEDISVVRRVVATLRERNKVIDVKTAKPPTKAELIEETIMTGTLGIPGIPGSSGVGSPIFIPGVARNDLHTLMNGVITLTNEESIQLKAELTPLWNEFKLGRMAAGVREMERMPSRLITAPKSSIQNASKIRADETQQNITFGNFMFWLLHTRLDSSKMRTWRGMLLYSAALGYNNLTQAQINWIITGHENGDLDVNTDFSTLNWEEGDPLDQQLEIKGQVLKPSTVKSLSAQVKGNPEPQKEYPSKNTSPSAAPIDNSIHPDGSTGPERANRTTFQGMPTRISNIPDPRFSRRGNEDVANVRITTIRNPNYDPTKSPEDPDYEPEFKPVPIDDLGAGSKEIGAHIEAAVSDRLLRSMPTKLYAPIHAQACDRYLGSINYQRLSLPIVKYMKSYSQHPWGPEDFQEMYEWNSYTMALYGTMLYAFVTDIKMQRITPIFDMSTPAAVGDEYMELNELISELAKYQQTAEDRAGRVGDDGIGKRPVEEHIDQYLKSQSDHDSMLLQQSNVVAISVPETPFPQSGVNNGTSSGTSESIDKPPPPPPQPSDTSDTLPTNLDPVGVAPLSTRTSIISNMDTGVRKVNTSEKDRVREQEEEMEKKTKIFKMFQRQ